MSAKIFLSTVSDEFRSYRERLRHEITLYYAEVKIQEDFKGLGGETLDMLDVYIESCDAVVHLVGNMTGACPGERGGRALLKKYPDLSLELPPLGEALKIGGVPYSAPGTAAVFRGGARPMDVRPNWIERVRPGVGMGF